MMRRILILNAGLIVLLGVGAARLRQDWKTFDFSHQPSAIKPRPETLPGLPVGTAAGPNTTDWTVIPTRNPFSFDRSDVTLVAPPEPPPPPKPLGPKPILFGTMNIGKDRMAMMASGQAGGNRTSRPVKQGEVFDGWTIVQIDDRSIVVEGNAGRETIPMNDPSAQVQRDHTRTLAVSETVSVSQSVGSSSQAQGKPAAQTALPSGSSAPPSSIPPSGQLLPDGSRVIQTPFGPHIIPKDPPQQ